MNPDELVTDDSSPDMFGAHEKWSEQSIELTRWVWPFFLVMFAMTGAVKFGLGFDADRPAAFGVVGACCLLFSLGCVLYTLAGGPMRIEVDQAMKTVRWIHARRIRPTQQSWHFDEISQFSSLISAQHFKRYIDDDTSDRLPAEIDTYYVVMELTNGSRQLLFGKGFKESSRSSSCDVRLKKMVQLTGRPQKPIADRGDFAQMRDRVNAALGKKD